MRTIPIHVSKAGTPRLLRAKLLRYVHVAIACATGSVLPAITTYGFLRWYASSHALFGSEAATGILILCLLGVMMHTVASCSPGSMVLGSGGLGIFAFLPHVIEAALAVVVVAALIGLAAAHALYRALRSRVSSPDAYGTPEELNPRCGTCHARSFCPYQPGGLADRYTPKA